MAFDASGLNVVVSSIAGGILRIGSYETSDSLSTVTGSGYFTNASRYGLKVDSFIEVYGGDINYAVRIASIDSDGHATAVLVDNDAPNLLDWDGVDPTGENDSRSYLVSAIAQAQASKRMLVEIPGGFYVIDTDGGKTNVPEGLAIRGAGTGYQIRSPSTSTQGTLIGITGTTNSAFGVNRGCRISDLSFYWPDQEFETSSPTAYPYLITYGTDTATSGFAKAEFENLRLLNCDKFMKAGDTATSVGGSNLFVNNVKGMVFRKFIQQEDSLSLSEITRCAVSSTFGPNAGDLTRTFMLANCVFLTIDGENDGLIISDCQAFTINKFIHHTNIGAVAEKGINFLRVSNVMIDGCHQGYVAQSATTGIRNIQWSNCFFNMNGSDLDTSSATDAFDYTKSAALEGGLTNVLYSNCIFRSAMGKAIKIAGSEPVNRLVVTGCVFEGWADGSTASANTPAISINAAASNADIVGCRFTRDDSSHVGVQLETASQVKIHSSFDNMATAVNVTGAVDMLDLHNTIRDCRPLITTAAGVISDWVGPSRHNYIDNASFDAWQAGTSFALATNTDTFVADRWKCRRVGAGVTVSRVASSDSATYDLMVQRAEANSSTGAFRLWHQFEPAVVKQLAGKTVTLSFRLRVGATISSTDIGVGWHTGTAGGESVDLSSSVAGAFATGGAVTNETITAANQRFFLTPFTVPSDARDMAIRWGWTPSGTAGATDLWRITNVKLEVGTEPSRFEALPPEENLAKCQRFYAKSFLQATTPAQNVGSGTGEHRGAATSAGATTNSLGTIRLPVTMRAAPTVTLYNPAAANAQVRDLTTGADCSSSAAGNITETSFEVTCTANAGTAVGEVLGVHWTADARL